MAAYAIGSLTIHNTDWLKEYGEKMPALIHKHGGKLLAKSAPQALEGAPPLPGMVVMVEFPSAAHAQAWNEDPEHTPLRALRKGGAHFELTLLDGV